MFLGTRPEDFPETSIVKKQQIEEKAFKKEKELSLVLTRRQASCFVRCLRAHVGLLVRSLLKRVARLTVQVRPWPTCRL
jgi:hypothetical protein